MPLHLTKVAYGASSFEDLHDWFAGRGEEALVTTRYLPKRHAEILDGGSLFWIFKHQLVARSPILRFGEAEGGKTHIVIGARMIAVHPQPRRAHQGWRYLEDDAAPRDWPGRELGGELMPAALIGELAKLGLV
jgi:hypothetical protein